MTMEFILTGRISRKSRGKPGIHGIRVEVWAMRRDSGKLIGQTLTSQDGHYQMRFDIDALKLREPGSVVVHLFDRAGNRIHKGASRRRIRPGRKATINVTLVPKVLQVHETSPIRFAQARNFLPWRNMESEISSVVDQIAPPNTPENLSMQQVANCFKQPIELIDQLYDDAFRVLDGNSEAARRFSQTLALLQISQQKSGRKHNLISSNPRISQVEETRTGIEDSDEPGIGKLIPRDRTVPILAATAYLARSTDTVTRDLEFVLASINELESYSWFHQAALAAQKSPQGLKQFRGMLNFLESECNPDDGPQLPGLGLPQLPYPSEIEKHIECGLEVSQAFQQMTPFYYIEDVLPGRACPGETITITGQGFGSQGGVVQFRMYGTDDWIDAQPTTWTDTEITVVVPVNASCGIQLRILERTVNMCDRYVDVYRRGSISNAFEGTEPDIRWFTVNGRKDVQCVLPGDALVVRWEVCAADLLRVEIVDASTGSVLEFRDPAAPEGTINHTVPPGSQTRQLQVRVTADGTCAQPNKQETIDVWVHRVPNLTVQGMEVTQGIQHYRADQHLSDPADISPDNSLPLVTGKAAWVRVYVRSGQDPGWDNGNLTGVTGTLTVERIVGGVPTLVQVLSPQLTSSSFTAQANPSYTQERGNINNTLNFIIPANNMFGRLRLTANLDSSAAPCGGGSASGSMTVDVALSQTLRLAVTRVGYNGIDPTIPGAMMILAPPTMTQITNSLGYTLATYPVSATPTIRVISTITFDRPLTDARTTPGGCSPNWGMLLDLIEDAKANDGNQTDWFYYGFLPQNLPLNVGGCESGGVSAGPVGAAGTVAHELGHQLGRPHAPCGGVGTADANYPWIEPYANLSPGGAASIGEYGLDIRDGTIHPPTEFDFMSYCGPQWISVYGHMRSIQQIPMQPTFEEIGYSGAGGVEVASDNPIDLLMIRGEVDLDETYSVNKVARVHARQVFPNSRTGRVIAELLDEAGEQLSSARVHIAIGQGRSSGHAPCGCEESTSPETPYRFVAFLPWVDGGDVIRLRLRKDILWERKAFTVSPTIEITTCEVSPESELALKWSSTRDPAAESEWWIQWSDNDGKSWNGLAVGIRQERFKLDLSHLPAGPVRFKVLHHDGFTTVEAVTKRVRIPPRPPTVGILNPTEDAILSMENGLYFQGFGLDCHGNRLPDESLLWTLDGKEVGTGPELFYGLRAGSRRKHKITLTGHDRHGQSTASVTFFPERGRS